MARIKTTALASEVKGKYQGTVFSSNRGGAYIRNNKTGQKNTNPNSSKRKSNLSFLAQQWKGLSAEAQNAWNEAITSYPTQNIFGDARNPTGYELFMRLNATQLNFGYPTITLPLAPRAFNDVGTVQVLGSDRMQFVPRQVIDFNAVPTSVGQVYFEATSTALEIRPFAGRTFNVFFKYPENAPLNIWQNIPYLSLSGVPNQTLEGLQIRQTNERAIDIRLNDSGVGSTETIYLDSEDIKCQQGVWHAITLVYSSIVQPVLNIYIDGNAVGGVTLGAGITGTVTTAGIFSVGRNADDQRSLMAFSHYQVVDTKVDSYELAELVIGYYFESSIINYAFDKLVGNTLISNYSNNTNYQLSPNVSEDIAKLVVSSDRQLIQLIAIGVLNQGNLGQFLNVLASPPCSYGQRPQTTKIRSIKLIDWAGVSNEIEYEGQIFYSDYVTQEYRDQFVNVPAGSNINFFVQLYDSQTGVTERLKISAKPKKPRFKAGTELPEKVN